MQARRIRGGLALVGTLLLGACGSTAQSPATTTIGETGGLNAPTGTGTAQTPSLGRVSGAQSSPSGGATGPTASTPGSTRTARAADTGRASVPGTMTNPTISSHEPIKVGLIVEKNSAAAAQSFGVASLQNGDERAFAQALIEQINKGGGLSGHPLVPVYYSFDPNNQPTVPQIEQAACAAFTQDNHVFAALLAYHDYADHLLDNCLARRGVITINSAGILTGDAEFVRSDPLYYAPAGVTLQRQASNYVDALANQGFFGGSTKVGLAAQDQPDYHRAVSEALEPALRRVGVKLTDTAWFPPVNNSSDVAPLSSAMSSAVLKFHGEGINRVLFLGEGINGPLFFMRESDTQGYHPRYGLSTTDAPEALAGLVPSGQLEGSVVMGWLPVDDTDAAHETHSAPARSSCKELLRKTDESFSNRTVEYVGMSFCDSAWFFRTVVDSLGDRIDVDAFQAAAARLGAAYRSPMAFETQFSAGQRDAAAAYRILTWNGQAFVYANQPEKRFTT